MLDRTFDDLLGRHLTKPFSQFINTLRNKISDINELLDSPAALDQYPGRAYPFAFTRLFGPFGMTAARVGSPAAFGFDKLAPAATPAQYLLPRNGNIKVGRYGSFVWTETCVTTYLSWTYATPPGAAIPLNVEPFGTRNGDIWDTVVENNGGAMVMQNNRYVDDLLDGGAQADIPNIAYELGLYDKLRNRFLHDRDRLPFQLFAGQNFTNKKTAQGMRFDNNTELEPRLYINEVRPRTALSTDQAFNAARIKAYFVLTIKGRLEQQEP